MVSILVLSLVTAAQPAKSTSMNWVSSSTPPLVLAAQVDSAMHSLSNTVLEYGFLFKTAIGRGAQFDQCAFAGPKRFRIQYPVIGATEREGVKRVTLVANGTKMGRKVEDKPAKKMAFTTERPLPNDMVQDWFKGCASDLFSAVGSRVNPVTALVSQASKPGSGYVVHAEKRRIFNLGVPTDNDRIMIERSPAAAAKKGALLYEIVVDSRHYLPTSLSNTLHVGQMMYTVELNQAHWRRLTKDLDPKLFDTNHIF